LRTVATLGDAEHLGDHHERQREGEARDEVDVGAGRERGVEVLVDQLLHTRAQLLDHARREDLRQPAVAAVVVGRVEVEHVVVAALAALFSNAAMSGSGSDRERHHVVLFDAEARVAQHPGARRRSGRARTPRSG